MSKEEKLQRLLEMQEHPERYTDEEIRQLMADEEYRQLYDQMIRATDAVFAENHGDKSRGSIQKKEPVSLILKIAAMFIGVLMLSGIAYAAIHIVSRNAGGDSQSPTLEVRTPDLSQRMEEQSADSVLMQPVVFEDAELETILREIAAFYQCETIYKNERVKHVRLYFTWDKTARIDEVVETFNKFERFHITRANPKLIVE